MTLGEPDQQGASAVVNFAERLGAGDESQVLPTSAAALQAYEIVGVVHLGGRSVHLLCGPLHYHHRSRASCRRVETD